MSDQGNILQVIGEKYDSATVDAVARRFEDFQLPLPKAGEFAHGLEGWLVFLNDFGVVIRIEKDTRPGLGSFGFDHINDDPDILQPLCSWPAEKLVIEICPGIELPQPEDEVLLRRNLYSRGIFFWDLDSYNVGRIPIHTEEFPDGRAVVLDRNGVNRQLAPALSVRGWCAYVALKHKGELDMPDIQPEFYGPLRQAFANAAEPEKMVQAWALCKKSRQSGVLSSSWDRVEYPKKNLPDCGRNYASHLKAAGFGA